jgi:hypothetical protein
MKTKQQELDIIENAISHLYELEAMMRADCFPIISLSESQDIFEKQIKEATMKAKQILANAKQSADELRRENDAKITRSKEWAYSALQKAMANLQ